MVAGRICAVAVAVVAVAFTVTVLSLPASNSVAVMSNHWLPPVCPSGCHAVAVLSMVKPSCEEALNVAIWSFVAVSVAAVAPVRSERNTVTV